MLLKGKACEIRASELKFRAGVKGLVGNKAAFQESSAFRWIEPGSRIPPWYLLMPVLTIKGHNNSGVT